MSDEEKLQAFMIMRRNNVRSKDVALAIGISASALSQYLNNYANIKQSNVEKLQRYLAELESK